MSLYALNFYFNSFQSLMMRIKGNYLAESIASLNRARNPQNNNIRIKEPVLLGVDGDYVDRVYSSEAGQRILKQLGRLAKNTTKYGEYSDMIERMIGLNYLWMALVLYFGSVTRFGVKEPSTLQMLEMVEAESPFENFSVESARLSHIKTLIAKLRSLYSEENEFEGVVAKLFDIERDSEFAHRLLAVDMLLQKVNDTLFETLDSTHVNGPMVYQKWECLMEFLHQAQLPFYRRMEDVVSMYALNERLTDQQALLIEDVKNVVDIPVVKTTDNQKLV